MGLGMEKNFVVVWFLYVGCRIFWLDIKKIFGCWTWKDILWTQKFLLVMEKFCLDMKFFLLVMERFLWNEYFGMSILWTSWWLATFVLQNLKSRGSLQMLKGIWEILSPNIKNVINEAGFQTFFQALFNHDTYEYKDLQLLLSLSERFWDTTCTFHFLGIGGMMLTPYDFSAITGLRLGGERIKVNDFLTSKEIKSLLGVMPEEQKCLLDMAVYQFWEL